MKKRETVRKARTAAISTQQLRDVRGGIAVIIIAAVAAYNDNPAAY